MVNPVAPFYNWYIAFTGCLPQPFMAFLGLCMGVWIVLCLYTLFWSMR